MGSCYVTTLFFLLNSLLMTCMAFKSSELDLNNVVQRAHTMVVQANNWAQLSAHDESSLIFGHHRRHHGGKRGGGGGGGLTDGDTVAVDSHGGHHGGHHGRDDESTLDESLILGHHRHHRRHHGGGRGGGGRDVVTDTDKMTIDGHQGDGGGGGAGGDDSALDESLILGHHWRHRRRHGGRRGGGGGGARDDVTDTDQMTVDGHQGGGGDDGDNGDSPDSPLDDSLILGHHRHHRRHHGGRGGGGRGSDDNSTLDDSLILGHHWHHRRHHGGRRGGGGGGGHGTDNNSTSYTTLDSNIDNTYNNNNNNNNNKSVALSDCTTLYGLADQMLARVLENNNVEKYSREDVIAWLSGALTSHVTCLDGLKEKGMYEDDHPFGQNLTVVLNQALTLHAKNVNVNGGDNKVKGAPRKESSGGGDQYKGLLSSWNPATSKADIVVAKDGSGNYRTINDAVNALERLSNKGRGKRVVVHVKAGVYDENVDIGRSLINVMFVGEGIDKTVVTGRRNYADGDTTVSSATFRVFGDGFWARDMTFKNTAGPHKHQAVALMVASDNSLFYKCSIKGYQDTLYAHSLRQFYRDCKIYGTVDFIFGNAAVVLQNCDILVRKPMDHQANMITAQGRNNPYENTGISIHGSRILPAREFVPVKGSIKTFLGRPWKKYSRTVIAKTELDGMIHPQGWMKWDEEFALSTLYYAEYMNTGRGALTRERVNWPGYHVLRNPREVGPFTVRNFIQGESWIMKTGVPFWTEI